jgi:hypothetical protein
MSDTALYKAIPLPSKRLACKGTIQTIAFFPVGDNHTTPAAVSHPLEQPSFLKIHGNILYSVDYRSNIDTPYAEQNIYQHTVQTYLDVTVKDHYPMRVYLTNRFSNSGLFRNFSNLNAQFNPQQFNQQIKENIKNQLRLRAAVQDSLPLYHLLQGKQSLLANLRQWLQAPSTFQRMVETKEADMIRRKRLSQPARPSTDSLFETPAFMDAFKKKGRFPLQWPKGKNKKEIPSDSSYTAKADTLGSQYEAFMKLFAQKKLLADSLQQQVLALEQKYKQLQQQRQSGNDQSEIDQIKDVKQLQAKMAELHLPDTSLPKGYKQLFALRSFGIGRNMIDYSELSAKNISVTGVQIEYNPSYYVAVASGVIDYRFRDYIVQRGNQQRQYMNIIRAGRGMRDGNHVVFTYYFGSRQLYNAATTAQATVPNYNLVGYTVEGHYQLNATSSLVAEVAKSSLPYYNRNTTGKGTLLSDAVQFNDRSNEAYSLKLSSFIPATSTRLSGSYRHIGSNFQSFSVFTTGSSQTNWTARIDQPFFKRRLNITASLRTNDFVNPYIGNNFASSTVFKSLQATLRIKKWPTVSLGYSPSSQLTKIAGGQFSENLFYTMVANVSHFYRYKKTLFNSTLVYSRFYNKATDSGFVYFNTKNLLFSQNAFLGKLSVQANFSVSANTDYTLYVGEGSGQYQFKEWLSAGAGIKYNAHPAYSQTLIGYSANATIRVNKIGEFRLMMDKGFIPGSNKQLVGNDVGRFAYFKTF